MVDATRCMGTQLVVRSRQPGDRFRPLGLGGRKKCRTCSSTAKSAATTAIMVPIVTDAQDRIVWVAGHVIGEEFRVTDRTNAVIILKLRRI